MDRRLLFCALLLVTFWVHGQSQIPTGDLAVMGFLGTVGISAGVATAIISATAVKLQSDLKKCLEKSAEMDERIVVPDCPPTNEDCPNQLAQCEKEEEDLELERIQKLDLLEKACLGRPRRCACGRITDEASCDANTDCEYKTDKLFCVPIQNPR